ncbi:MAG: hypothetical protein BWK72_19825 [Rhodoferax ferrireducens]|uniref:Uncharacterized protein n=1 Tax=Rhodoferax ferrireducens TaxID=192843 RepID=A0A1W9KP45_9BURK|nr:MAG: hypothetical protein BWK72_19825 [Rhodoferax ferrireducens]
MLFALIGFTLFSLRHWGLWSLWCSYAPGMLLPTAPRWVRRPNFFLLFHPDFVLIYQGASKK